MVSRLAAFGGGWGGAGGGGGGGGAAASVGSGTGAAGAAGSTGGSVAQPATNRTSSDSRLVTQPDAQYIDIRLPEPGAKQVEFIQVVDGADADAVVSPVVDRDPLHV